MKKNVYERIERLIELVSGGDQMEKGTTKREAH